MTDVRQPERLDGLAALVTGGSRGVGKAIAFRIAALGASVAISYRKDVVAAEAVVAAIRAGGGTALALAADLRQPGVAADVTARAIDVLGPLSIIVSNAGMASRGLPTVDTSREEFIDQLQLHALALVEMAAVGIPGMRTAGFGSIVSIGSSVVLSLPANTAPYAMGKTAGQAVVRVLALEERQYGIRVNTVAPGLVATDMGSRLVSASGAVEGIGDMDALHPFGRVCRPEDVAEAVAFLSRPDGYITGQTFVVDGGGPVTSLF